MEKLKTVFNKYLPKENITLLKKWEGCRFRQSELPVDAQFKVGENDSKWIPISECHASCYIYPSYILIHSEVRNTKILKSKELTEKLIKDFKIKLNKFFKENKIIKVAIRSLPTIYELMWHNKGKTKIVDRICIETCFHAIRKGGKTNEEFKNDIVKVSNNCTTFVELCED